MSRRRLVVAVAVAFLAAMGVWSVARGGEPGDIVGSGVVGVVRVAGDVARGTTAADALADGSLEVIEVPVTDPAAAGAVVPEALVGTVATTSVAAGGLLAPGVFAIPGGPEAGLTARFPTPGHTALALTLDTTRAVGGWVQPGDRVNLLVPGVCADEEAARASAAETGAEVRCRRARYLYQAVDVLAVGAALAPGDVVGASGVPEGSMTPGGSVTVVLSLPPRAAQWVATWENELTLALVAPDYIPRVVDPLPTVVERLPGELDATLQPGCADPGAPGPPGELPACPGESVS